MHLVRYAAEGESMTANNTLERPGGHRGRIVLAKDCVPAEAQQRRRLAAQLGR